MHIIRTFMFLSLLCIPVAALAVSGSVPTSAAGAKPIQQFTKNAPVVADTLEFTGNGFLNCIIFEMADALPTAGTITIYDNTAESGTIIHSHTFTAAVFTPIQYCPQRPFTTGLYIGMNGPADINTSVSRRP